MRDEVTLDEWAAALVRFEGGYGDPPDLTDPEDRAAFLALLREEVRDRLEREIAAAFRKATARLLSERDDAS